MSLKTSSSGVQRDWVCQPALFEIAAKAEAAASPSFAETKLG